MKKKIIAGADEVGIGPLAGPVTVCILSVPSRFYQPLIKKLKIKPAEFIKDSKALSPSKREEIFEKVKSLKEIEWKIASVSPKIIDRINILQASFLAYQRCFKKLKIKPDIIFVDGNKKIPKISVPQLPIIGGDKRHPLIALASIMAKVSRDKMMVKLSKKFPEYKFEIHKGYATKTHLKVLKKHKPSIIHRKSYQPVFETLPFKEKVLYVVSKIRKGEIMTYKQVADLAGSSKAYRAVGNILAKNYDKSIPCHRVIRSDGKLGNYNRGKKLKRKLLEKEKALPKK